MIDSIKHADLWLFLIYLGSITCITCPCKFDQSVTTDLKADNKVRVGWLPSPKTPHLVSRHLLSHIIHCSPICGSSFIHDWVQAHEEQSIYKHQTKYYDHKYYDHLQNTSGWKNIKRRKLSWINYELPMSGSGIALTCVHLHVQRFVEIADMTYLILPYKSWNKLHMNLYNNKSPASTWMWVQIIYIVFGPIVHRLQSCPLSDLSTCPPW